MTAFIAAFIIFSLSISGAYYDPVQAESGSEAIQLENTGPDPVSLDGVLLSTKQSTYPLSPVTLLPGQGYLVADNNWSTLRDNLTWPGADQELPLSLANTEGFVSLIKEGTLLDTLVWNSTNKAREGRMLTGDGETTPFFRNSSSTTTTIPATLIVIDAPPVITSVQVTDDSPTPGVQLLSYERVITVTAHASDSNNDSLALSVHFQANAYDMTEDNGTYTAHIALSKLQPGEYTLTVVAASAGMQTTYPVALQVLATSSISVQGSLTLKGQPGASANSSFVVSNDGNIAKTILLRHTVQNLSCDAQQFMLEPEEEQRVTCTITVPLLPPGTYNYTVQLTAS